MCDTLDMNTHIPKPVKEEKEPEKTEQKEEEKKEEDKEKVWNVVLIASSNRLSDVATLFTYSNGYIIFDLFFSLHLFQAEDEKEKEKEKEADEKNPATEVDEKPKETKWKV